MSRKIKGPAVAYFCMEFGLQSDFKIYSGGLGILAGDILKAAKDQGYPLVGVGILWRQGYVKQVITPDGQHMDCFPELSYDFLIDTRVVVDVRIRGRIVKCKVWKCNKFGNVPLYLLDVNLPENADRLLTGQLYGWFGEERIAQEIILGVGGVKALRALGIKVDLYHFNDSHPLLAGIELIRQLMEYQGLSFDEAWSRTKKQIVFTTHTPVIAGNEVHEHELLRYMGAYGSLTYGQMVKLGGDPFSMTVAGLRLARKANAVAQLHCKTARKMWSAVEGAAEIIPITNGVHNGTWQERRVVDSKNAKELWDVHQQCKRELIEEVYKRNGVRLDQDVLLIGFARRAAEYKRSDLIFKKKALIEPLLKKGKLQIIFSGKAHPNDLGGKKIVMRLVKFAKRYPKSVVFLQDYDMTIGALLTRGCDVWLNNPVRPMEACGTSGMKAAMNGVLNLSVLDGWWPEGCKHGVNGWQIGGGYEGPKAGQVDADSLYRALQREVIPTYYRNHRKWVAMMRNSIRMAQEKFSAARMVRDYYNQLYR